MLNESQIEAAARKLCELRGIKFGGESLAEGFGEAFALMGARDEIRAYLQVQEALAFASIEPVPTERLNGS